MGTINRIRCLLGKHEYVKRTFPRLMRLDDSWPPNMIDGLPFGGTVYECAHCKAKEHRP